MNQNPQPKHLEPMWPNLSNFNSDAQSWYLASGKSPNFQKKSTDEKFWHSSIETVDSSVRSQFSSLNKIDGNRTPNYELHWSPKPLNKLWSPTSNESSEWPSIKNEWQGSKSPCLDDVKLAVDVNSFLQLEDSEQVPDSLTTNNVFQSVWSPPHSSIPESRLLSSDDKKWSVSSSVDNIGGTSFEENILGTAVSTETLNNEPPTSTSCSLPESSQEPTHIAGLSHGEASINAITSTAAGNSDLDDLLTRLINAHDGWGSRHVDQSTPWEDESQASTVTATNTCPTSSGDIQRSGFNSSVNASKSFLMTTAATATASGGAAESFGLLQETNVWTNEPPTGTGVWELHYEQQGKKTARWQPNRNTHDICQTPVGALPLPKLPVSVNPLKPVKPTESLQWSNVQNGLFPWAPAAPQLPAPANHDGPQQQQQAKLVSMRPLVGASATPLVQNHMDHHHTTPLIASNQNAVLMSWVKSAPPPALGFSRAPGASIGQMVDDLDGSNASFESWPTATYGDGAGGFFNDNEIVGKLATTTISSNANGGGGVNGCSGSGATVHPYSHTYRADLVKHFMQLGYKKEDVQTVLINCNMEFERSFQQLQQHCVPVRMQQPNVATAVGGSIRLPAGNGASLRFNSSSASPPPSSPIDLLPGCGVGGGDMHEAGFFDLIDESLNSTPSSQFRGLPRAVTSTALNPTSNLRNTHLVTHSMHMVSGTPCPPFKPQIVGQSRDTQFQKLQQQHQMQMLRSGANGLKMMHPNSGSGGKPGPVDGGSILPGSSGFPHTVSSLLGSPPEGSGPLGLSSPVGLQSPIGAGVGQMRTPRHVGIASSIQELQQNQQLILRRMQVYRNDPVISSQPQYVAIVNELRNQLHHVESQLRVKEAHLRMASGSSGLDPSVYTGGGGGGHAALRTFNDPSNDPFFGASAAAANQQFIQNALSKKFIDFRLKRNSAGGSGSVGNNPPSSNSSNSGQKAPIGGFRGMLRPGGRHISENSFSPDENAFRGQLSLQQGDYGSASNHNNNIGSSSGGIFRHGGGQWVIIHFTQQQIQRCSDSTSLDLLLGQQQPGPTHLLQGHQHGSALARYQTTDEAMQVVQALRDRIAIDLISGVEAHAIYQEIAVCA